MTDEKMYNDCCSESDELSSCESTMEAEAGSCTGKGRRHTPAQLATLNAYFKFGMVGVGKNYSALITAASRDCNLSEKKVKVNYSLHVYILCFYFTLRPHKKN